jgi:Tfp pilus assembly protein PilO
MWQGFQTREKILLAALGVVVLTFVIVKFLLIPQISAHGENKAALVAMQSKLQTAEAVAGSQKQETALASKTEEVLDRLKPVFDKIMDDGLALVQIGLQAEETGVEIVLFKPSTIIDREVYLMLPCEFQVRGAYPAVIDFIAAMETLPELSELRKLKVEPFVEKRKEAPGDAGNREAVSYEDNYAEVVPVQDGRVEATFKLVTFTDPAPGTRLQLEQVLKWAGGRYNSFETPPGMMHLPPPDAEGIARTVNKSVYN